VDRPADPSPAALEGETKGASRPGAKRPEARVVSPELALIDAELARAERTRLDERARLAAYNEAGARADDALFEDAAERIGHTLDGAGRVPDGVRRDRTGLRPPSIALAAALFATFIAGGLAVAWLVAGHEKGATSSPQQRTRVVAPPAENNVKAVRSGHPSAFTAQLLERRLLTLLAGAPVSKLPRPLVDVGRQSTRTDLRAVCRGSGAGLFRCVVRSPRRPRNEGLHVRYRLRESGEGVFEWLGYRR
jgi:hypothetical protein